MWAAKNEDFFKVFNHKWAWWQSWSWDQTHLNYRFLKSYRSDLAANVPLSSEKNQALILVCK